MRMEDAKELLHTLELGQAHTFYRNSRDVEVTATRTDKMSTKDNDVTCLHDFVVGFSFPDVAIDQKHRGKKRKMNPTHLSLFETLYVKRLLSPAKAHVLFCALERVYVGDDLDVLLTGEISDLIFPSYEQDEDVYDVGVTLHTAQLLLIEQDFSYSGEIGCRTSQLTPPRANLMGYIRAIASGWKLYKVISTSNRGPSSKNLAYKPLSGCNDSASAGTTNQLTSLNEEKPHD